MLLVSGAVVVLELKGKTEPEQADLDQAAAYARDLRCYHRHCAEREVHAVVVPTRAPGYVGVRDGVHICGPGRAARAHQDLQRPWEQGPLTAEEFLARDAYCPLPTLVQAARELFIDGKIRPIHRARAETDPAIDEIARIAHEAASTHTRHLVLVTGVPGSGKTLVGLSAVHNPALDDLAVERAGGKPTAPAIFLSGNGPLVQVLQYELRGAGGGGKTFVRDVKNYVKQYLGDKAGGAAAARHRLRRGPARLGRRAGRRPSTPCPSPMSEPEAFVDFGERIPEWCVLVGLIGRDRRSTSARRPASGSGATALEQAGDPRLDGARAADGAGRVLRTDRRRPHLPRRLAGAAMPSSSPSSSASTSPTTWTSGSTGCWTTTVTGASEPRGDAAARRAAASSPTPREHGYHLRMTRDLEAAKRYLREPLRRGSRRALRPRRLVTRQDPGADWGVPNGWHSTQRVQLGPWYGEGDGDPRSCRSLTQCVTEFGAQGLELDAVLLAWGTDLIRVGRRAAGRTRTPSGTRAARTSRTRSSCASTPTACCSRAGATAAVIFVPPDCRSSTPRPPGCRGTG